MVPTCQSHITRFYLQCRWLKLSVSAAPSTCELVCAASRSCACEPVKRDTPIFQCTSIAIAGIMHSCVALMHSVLYIVHASSSVCIWTTGRTCTTLQNIPARRRLKFEMLYHRHVGLGLWTDFSLEQYSGLGLLNCC